MKKLHLAGLLADADFAGADMIMHVKDCADNRIAIPFHVKTGEEWDRSRTWLITREGERLRLKHDHRHKDGKEDAVTMYGGDTVEAGTASAQHFIVDPESIALFKQEGLDASVHNVWSVEVDGMDAEASTFAYQLQRTVEGGAAEERASSASVRVRSLGYPRGPAAFGATPAGRASRLRACGPFPERVGEE